MESAANTAALGEAAAIGEPARDPAPAHAGAAGHGAAGRLPGALGGRSLRARVAGLPAMLHLRDYVALTKPRIISLLLLTTVTTMFVADPAGPSLSTILWTMLGGYLAAGGAGAINHYLDRERDAHMDRTRSRPLVAGRIEPLHGLIFGLVLGVLSVVVFALAVNPLAAGLSLAGFIGYAYVYTVLLKPLTPQNIVIGGAAGAIPPLVGWAAASGSLTWDSLWMFAIVFMWTPPHFWALALLIKDDYARIGVPMLPVVRGEAATRRQILGYSLALVGLSLGPWLTGLFGLGYALAALVFGGGLVALAGWLLRRPSRRAALRVYLASLAYLAMLFIAMALDRAL